MVRAQALGLSWAEVEPLSEEALEERLYGPRAEGQPAPAAAGSDLPSHSAEEAGCHLGPCTSSTRSRTRMFTGTASSASTFETGWPRAGSRCATLHRAPARSSSSPTRGRSRPSSTRRSVSASRSSSQYPTAADPGGGRGKSGCKAKGVWEIHPITAIGRAQR